MNTNQVFGDQYDFICAALITYWGNFYRDKSVNFFAVIHLQVDTLL